MASLEASDSATPRERSSSQNIPFSAINYSCIVKWTSQNVENKKILTQKEVGEQ